LKVEDLAASLGVSKTPVKHALKQLASEGFVTLAPYRSAIVSELSANDAEEIYIMRIGLEALITRLAVERITPAAIATMQRLCNQLDTLTEDAHGFLNTDMEFHLALYHCAGRESLVQRITALRNSSMRYIMTLVQLLPGHLRASQQVHYELLQACKECRALDASTIITRDLQRASDIMVEYLRAHRVPGVESTVGGKAAIGSR
jgi:DNA-binding GntR family transcriptional regulator